jgi:hypothetical protein
MSPSGHNRRSSIPRYTSGLPPDSGLDQRFRLLRLGPQAVNKSVAFLREL